jgi:peptide methionine sulfoxide reductase MsrB
VKTIIHVHQQKIRKGEDALIMRTYKGSTRHRKIDVDCQQCGHHVGTFVQSETPDHCGARVWFETDLPKEAAQ